MFMRESVTTIHLTTIHAFNAHDPTLSQYTDIMVFLNSDLKECLYIYSFYRAEYGI
jgi:hypothetical protein